MKKVKYFIVFALLGALVWYLFIKPHDYVVRFKVQTSPGTVYTSVEEWNFINQELDSSHYKINDKKAYISINQTLNLKERDLDLDWSFNSLNDTTTHVIVGVTEKNNSIYNRITTPFSNTKFKQTAINTIKGFKAGIEKQLEEKFKVTYIGIDSLPETAYAYVAFKNIEMRKKAEQMMKYNAKLLQFINLHNLKNGNYPFLIVDKWNLDKSIIDFRFCFPIKKRDSLPIHKDIKFDILKPRKALKAIYNGNYMTSDRAWFALHEYAKRHNISIDNKPLEIFYDNPFYGGDELKWKAAIFMPIK